MLDAGAAVVGHVSTEIDIEALPPSECPPDVVVSTLSSVEFALSVVRRLPGTAMLVLPLPVHELEIAEGLLRKMHGLLMAESRENFAQESFHEKRPSEFVLSKESEDVLLRLLRMKHLSVDIEGTLTPRERQVVEHMTEGRSNKQIARSLGIAEQTVKNYAHRVMRKVGVSSRTELCRWALEHGFRRSSPEAISNQEA